MGTYFYNRRTGDAMGSEEGRFGKKQKKDWAVKKTDEFLADEIQVKKAAKEYQNKIRETRKAMGLC